MYTRTPWYLVTYIIVVIMLKILDEVMLKTLKKKHAFANVYAYCPQGTLNLFCLLDRFLGTR